MSTTEPAITPRRRAYKKRAAIALLALAVVWAAGFAMFAHHVWNQQPQNASQPTDAIIVLTGGALRVNKGLDLLSTGQGKKLFITGVNGHVSLQEIMALWKRPIIAGEDNDCCIVLDHSARNTIQNAQETREWAQKEKIRTIRLVTSDYHMPRAWLEFHATMPGITIIPHPVKAHTDKDEGNFLRLIFGEYNKTILTWMKVYLLPARFRSWLEPKS